MLFRESFLCELANGLLHLKTNPPLSRTSAFGDFYPSGMKKNLCNWPLWKRLEPPLEVHFCILTPLERAFFFHFYQIPLWKKWLISPLEIEVLDRGGMGIKCNSPIVEVFQLLSLWHIRQRNYWGGGGGVGCGGGGVTPQRKVRKGGPTSPEGAPECWNCGTC